jgi:hypothetical protein
VELCAILIVEQGASLAADRGKIEAENEALARELEAARHEAKRAEDAVKIKVVYSVILPLGSLDSLGWLG